MNPKLSIVSSSDWHKAILQDEVVSEGHSLGNVLLEVLVNLGVEIERKEISDEEMENL